METSIASIMLGALILSACGGSQVPARQIAESHAAIRAAEEVGAEQNPKAALHLKLARDQLVSAEKLIDDGDHETAIPVLERAEIDAELALVLARLESTQRAAQQSMQRVEELRSTAESR